MFSLDLDGTVKVHKTGVSISNGPAWSEDNRTMFYADSLARKIWAYDFDLDSGTIGKLLRTMTIPSKIQVCVLSKIVENAFKSLI